uniref:RRM domain-containing protein n=1 Tax=Setaria digitata TaxID=48799 RepID=A0A915Q836_9BILA
MTTRRKPNQNHIYFKNNEKVEEDKKPEVNTLKANLEKNEKCIPNDDTFARFDSRCKSWRLIVRNLSFKTTKEDLQSAIGGIGPVAEIVLPKCKDKRFPNSCAGFAFIQFRKRQDAVKALEKLNMSELFGRKIAVDWALSKDTYETAVYEEKQEHQEVKKEIKEVESVDSSEVKKEGNTGIEIKEDIQNDDSSDEGICGVENKAKRRAEQEFKEDKGVIEGRVIFIRNLSYETTSEAIKETLSKFGKISLAIVCCYAGSEHSKGTAFVHFETADEADKCLFAIDQAPGVLIDGRRIFGHRALSRREAATIEKEKLSKKPKDKRNLYLLRAGFIRPGTTSAADMSETDADKRARLAVSARQKLKNLHMFVSPTRLVVHNLPKSLTDKAFRSLCFIAAGNPDAKITECRIWRDRNKLSASGEALSRGFGFVNFLEHRDALSAMKHLNNNPDIFTKEKRPIVEFSIENLAAIRLRELRVKKSKQDQSDNEQVLCSRNTRDLEQTKKRLSAGGQKPLPSYLGPKIRKKDANTRKAQVKERMNKVKEKVGRKRKQQTSISSTGPRKKRISRNKQLMKYLTLSS